MSEIIRFQGLGWYNKNKTSRQGVPSVILNDRSPLPGLPSCRLVPAWVNLGGANGHYVALWGPTAVWFYYNIYSVYVVHLCRGV